MKGERTEMKKIYEEPTLQTTEFKCEDSVATTSFGDIDTPASGFEK